MKTGFIRTAGFLLGISLLLGGAGLAQEPTDAGDQEALQQRSQAQNREQNRVQNLDTGQQVQAQNREQNRVQAPDTGQQAQAQNREKNQQQRNDKGAQNEQRNRYETRGYDPQCQGRGSSGSGRKGGGRH